MLHGEGGDLWKAFNQALEVKVSQVRSDYAKQIVARGFLPPQIVSLPQREALWRGVPSEALVQILQHRLSTRPPEEWRPFIGILATTSDLLRVHQAPFLRAACHFAQAQAPEPQPWKELLETLPAPTADSVPSLVLPEVPGGKKP